MELVHGTRKASKFAPEDVINSMPENVITNIMDRLPIQDAVRTGILSRNWRFKWTMLTHLVFDVKFFEYLQRTEGKNYFDGRNLSRILLHLKGAITKFVLCIPPAEDYKILDVEDINHLVLFLSRKGIKEFTLINMLETPLKLPTHLFSCLELKHLKLNNCCFRPAPSFRGFPNLLSLDFNLVRFESWKCGEFITRCPLLEILKFSHHNPTGEVKPVEIAKLENLKMLSLPLCKLGNMAITSFGIFQLMGFLPKLQELDLDFRKCKFVAEVGAGKRVPAAFRCLKTLRLYRVDFSSRIMVSCAFEMICGSPNLQTLKITATYKDDVPPPALCSSEVDCSTMGQLQLGIVVLVSIRGSENEVCLIKSLLACSPSLKKMVVHPNLSPGYGGDDGKLMFARKLLKLHRASPIAEIDLY